jgi:hypothetical protein
MAFDEALADRVRRVLGPRPDVTEKKMFGGIAFLHCYVFVSPAGCRTDRAVKLWVDWSTAFVATVKKKPARPRRPRAARPRRSKRPP